MKDSRKDSYRENMSIVIVGHVDHGKSTIIGRLLADTGSLPKGKLEQVRETCRRNSKPFEYAFLLDALKDEQAQGITIDAARCFFKTDKRKYLITDAPGHVEFLKNMVTGASRAEAALLVIDAMEGIKENSRRHGYLLSMLGIRQIVVLVNKMDLVEYNQKVYEDICRGYSRFLERINIKPYCFIPVSGRRGDNIAIVSENMKWYSGGTVLDVLDQLKNTRLPEDKPFRMPVQGVYKFTGGGDTRRIVAGTVETGRLHVGDEVIFYPSGKKSTVATIEAFSSKPQTSVGAGYATGFTLREQIYIRRGELAAVKGQAQPMVGKRLRVNLFWLGKQPMKKNKEYILKLGTAKLPVVLEDIIRVMDASNLQSLTKECIDRNDVAECVLLLDKATAFDLAENIPATGRFVIVDNYEISGGGIIQELLKDKQSWVRDKVTLRNYKWEMSRLTPEERAAKYNQRSTLIFITGQKDVGKKSVAKVLEKKLFDDGRLVYFLGMANILYGAGADIKGQTNNRREEHFRRLAEIANLMLDAGCILIVTARELTREDMEIVQTVINPEKTMVVWVGKNITTDVKCSLHIPSFRLEEEAAGRIKVLLQDEGIIFKP
jgi:bifunctional enzyme CysN/CysC